MRRWKRVTPNTNPLTVAFSRVAMREPIGSTRRLLLDLSVALTLALLALSVLPPSARAGGAGVDIPPFPLPVRQTELRLATQARLVCVADPYVACDNPFLDAPSSASNTDGATLRSTSCPGSPPGACRPAYIAGAELTGELVVDWPIVRSPVGGAFPPPDPAPGLICSPDSYKICHVNGLIELNVTAPGVVVSNPVISLDSTSAELGGMTNECRCIGPFDLEGEFAGEQIGRLSNNDDDDWWFTRNVGATCDVALEYSEFIRRDLDLIREIGETAFPEILCQGLGAPPCGSTALPIFVEPDGSLTKGCGDAPSNTFAIRFALPNEPRTYLEKPIAGATLPRALGDVNGDQALDLVGSNISDVYLNDGSNLFTPQATGLSGLGPALTDWTNDGDLDLVAVDSALGLNRDVIVYPGDGTGGFSSAASFVLAPSAARSSDQIEIVDFNNDGLLDARWAFRIAYNETGGSISPPIEFVSVEPESLGIADLDGNSLPDLLNGIFESPVVEWSENDGPGTYVNQTLLTLPEPDELASVIGQEALDYLECDSFGNDCCSLNRTPGCEDNPCETAVCNEDSSCCISQWGANCVDLARQVCSVCIDPAKPDCCDVSAPKIGCEIPSCAAIVCEQEPFCCDDPWDSICVREAKRWCSECREYDVTCREPEVRRAAGADVDGDGDTDLILAIQVPQDIFHPRNLVRPTPTYFTWLPNRQVEDPVLAAGDPLFDAALSPWQPIGPGAARIELADLDNDSDVDLVSQIDNQGFWYRNDSGSFTGPYAVRGAVTPPSNPEDLNDFARIFLADADRDNEVDIIVSSSLYESLPEPTLGLALALGVTILSQLGRNRARKG